jgi:hypothetical protein
MSQDKMPFSGHSGEDLQGVLNFLKETPLPIECLDAFLYDYKNTGNLDSAVFFARCEWDC